MPPSSPSPTSPPLKVLITGCGFAGLTAAIECHRHGHSPTILESHSTLSPLGDIISFGPNAGNIFSRWPGIPEKLAPICIKTEGLHYRNWDGEYLFYQKWDEKELTYGPKFNGHRGEIHGIVLEYARDLGVEVRLGERVTDYFEEDSDEGEGDWEEGKGQGGREEDSRDEDSKGKSQGQGRGRCGVISNGRRIYADVVLGADGVRSKARSLVLGYEDKPKASGYAIYRAWFDAEKLWENERTRFLVENGDYHGGWLGPDVHFLAASIKDGREFSWVCTHKDDADVEEGWQTPGLLSDAHKVLEGWDPIVHDIIDATPFLVDWKLVYRDPLPTWVSPKGRIALIGDAAHPFLPTSIQGASQAMEDGATIAVCLELAGRDNIPTALRVFEKIRYERVLKAQKTGEATRDKWHKADFKKVKSDPESMKLVRHEWLLNFDAEKHAYAVWEETVRELREGKGGVKDVDGKESLEVGAPAVVDSAAT